MNIVLIGSGAHAGAVIQAVSAAGDTVTGLYDEMLPQGGVYRHGFNVNIPNIESETQVWFIAIGDNAIRERFSRLNNRFVNIKHPAANVEKDFFERSQGRGRFFGAFSHIGHQCLVGDFTIINSGVILEHDSTVGSFSNLCPGVMTGGRVKIGDRTTIGLGVMIRDGITIGNDVTVGMGAVVLGHIPDNATVWGTPARVQK